LWEPPAHAAAASSIGVGSFDARLAVLPGTTHVD
jgi:hypothetical protein